MGRKHLISVIGGAAALLTGLYLADHSKSKIIPVPPASQTPLTPVQKSIRDASTRLGKNCEAKIAPKLTTKEIFAQFGEDNFKQGEYIIVTCDEDEAHLYSKEGKHLLPRDYEELSDLEKQIKKDVERKAAGVVGGPCSAVKTYLEDTDLISNPHHQFAHNQEPGVYWDARCKNKNVIYTGNGALSATLVRIGNAWDVERFNGEPLEHYVNFAGRRKLMYTQQGTERTYREVFPVHKIVKSRDGFELSSAQHATHHTPKEGRYFVVQRVEGETHYGIVYHTDKSTHKVPVQFHNGVFSPDFATSDKKTNNYFKDAIPKSMRTSS
jgi:hypothetical protein